MSLLLDFDWKKDSINDLIRLSATEILNHETKGDEYVLSIAKKIYDLEKDNKTVDTRYRTHIFIHILYDKLVNQDFNNIDRLFENVPIEEIPMVATCFLFALEDRTYQYDNMKTEEDKNNLYSYTFAIFMKVKSLIERYDDKFFRNNYKKYIDSVVFYKDEPSDKYNLRYGILSYRFCLMLVYKSIKNIEADYISKMATGKTWEEAKEISDSFDYIN